MDERAGGDATDDPPPQLTARAYHRGKHDNEFSIPKQFL